MSFTPRNWTDGSAPAVSAANIEDLETRVTDYTDTRMSGRDTGIYNVLDFGATGDGVTDDTAAIQDALDEARFHVPREGGDAALQKTNTIWFPEGTYVVSSTLDVHYTDGFKIAGAGADSYKHAAMHPTIQFEGGASSGPVLDLQNCNGVTLQGLRFVVTDVDFDGWIIDLSGPLADSQLSAIIGCSFAGPYSATMAGHIYLNKSIIGKIDGCHFVRGGIQIAVGNTNYAVGWTISNSTFNTAYDVPIRIKGGAEAINIGPNNVFEQATAIEGDPDRDGGSRAIRFEDNNCWICNVEGNWFGDAAGDPWILVTSGASWLQGMVTGNRFSGGSTAPALQVDDGAAIGGINYMSNRNDNCPLVFPSTGTTSSGNIFLASGPYGSPGDDIINPEHSGAVLTNFGGLAIAGQENGESVAVGWQSTNSSIPAYKLDVKGIPRFFGSVEGVNGIAFGGTEGAEDADLTLRPTYGEATWDPGSLADGAMAYTDVTVAYQGTPIAAQANFIAQTAPGVLATAGMVLSAVAIGSNTVRVVLVNHTGGVVDAISETVRVLVWTKP